MEKNKFNFIENTNQNNPKSSPPKIKSRFWIFGSVFLGIIIVFWIGLSIYSNYLDPNAKYIKEANDNYKKIETAKSQYEETMKNDIHGGKTPEETLALFTNALEERNADLASKYFIETNDMKISDWKEGIEKATRENKIDEIISGIENAKISEKSESMGITWLTEKDANGQTKNEILLKLNKYADIWKIESL